MAKATLLRLLVDSLDAESEGSRARRYVFRRYPFSLVYILRGDAAL